MAPKGPEVQSELDPSSQEVPQTTIPPNNTVPSPGLCSADYEPLATLRQSASTSPVIPSPPQKRRVFGRSGKVMK